MQVIEIENLNENHYANNKSYAKINLNDNTIELYYSYTKCSCDYSRKSSNKSCEHIKEVYTNTIENLGDLKLVYDVKNISLYNFTKGRVIDHLKGLHLKVLLNERVDGPINDVCSICLENITSTKCSTKCTTCVEHFHKNCIMTYNKPTCPVCRSFLEYYSSNK